MSQPAAKHPPPWLFAVIGIPYGTVGSLSGQIMPYLTDKHGIDLDSIGWFNTILFIPAIFQFLYAPTVDVKFSRRVWLLITSILAAACMVGAFLTPLPEHKRLFLAFGFMAAVLAALVSACIGGLLSVTMPDELRGAASGWYNIGNLSGGGVSAFVAIWMTGHYYTELSVGLVIAAMMILPAMAVLAVVEPPRDHIRTVREVFGTTLHDVKAVLFSKSGLTGMALCVSPVGTAALTNFFSAMKTDFHASDDLVAWVAGGASTIVTAIGALIGGYLCDRFNRRALYLLSGLLTAVSAFVMTFTAHTPVTFGVGVTVYNLVTGFCYAAFTATVLETIGKAGKAASTQYALFVSAGNLAITYVGKIDTHFKDRYGINGVFDSDALLNVAGVIILAIAFWKLGSFGHRTRQRATSSSDARG